MRLPAATILTWIALTVVQAQAVDFRIENEFGGVSARISMDGRFELALRNDNRVSLQRDVKIVRTEDVVEIIAQPHDGVAFDMEFSIPFGATVNVRTTDGKISLDGYPARFAAQTASGEISLRAPWEATRLRFISRKAPKNVSVSDKRLFRSGRDFELGQKAWILEDRLKDSHVSYGTVRIRSLSTTRLTIEEMPLPDDAPVKMHWEAKRAYKALMEAVPARLTTPAQEEVGDSSGIATDTPTGVMFSSSVRLVNLQVAVYDDAGAPIADLKPGDFRVFENGVQQEIQTVDSEGTPFNLVLLFDLSSSTQRNRNQMKQIASGFLAVARPRDKVAAYVLANNWFGVLSRLTPDRELLAQSIGKLPNLSGGSPLYDAMVLAYAEELAQRPDERNALVVISDGVDNRLYGIGQPSEVSFTDVKRAAARMNALLYPVFLGPAENDLTKGSRPYEAFRRFRETAELAGGRVFSADTMAEFHNVYEDFAAELRAVYSVSYSPKNQDFKGEFRPVDVTVSREGATARTRPGYTAR